MDQVDPSLSPSELSRELPPAKRAPLWLLYLPFLVLVGLPFATGEQFPFSPFPMYNQWSEKTYLIYFVDKNGEDVPIQVLTTFNAARYRKMFDSQQRKIQAELKEQGIKKSLSDMGLEEWKPCGLWVLDWMERTVEPGRLEAMQDLRPLQVIRRDLLLKDGKIHAEDTVVASDEELEAWRASQEVSKER